MGKIRVAELGDTSNEKEQKRKADARRQTKQSKKAKVEGLGLHGGERVSVVEGTDIKPEFRKLVDEVEKGESTEISRQSSDTQKKKKESKAHVRSKRYQKLLERVDKTKLYTIERAVKLVKETSTTKFDGTVEIHVNLNPMTMGDKKDLRGTVSLPHGSGKVIRVVIADEKVLTDLEAGKIEFDILIASPAMMPKLAKFARVLGPKGLMPNPKTGTVSPDPQKRAKELSQGQINFKTEPNNPIIHMRVGKVSFEESKLTENVTAVIAAIGTSKISRVTLSSTMGPGIKIQFA